MTSPKTRRQGKHSPKGNNRVRGSICNHTPEEGEVHSIGGTHKSAAPPQKKPPKTNRIFKNKQPSVVAMPVILQLGRQRLEDQSEASLGYMRPSSKNNNKKEEEGKKEREGGRERRREGRKKGQREGREGGWQRTPPPKKNHFPRRPSMATGTRKTPAVRKCCLSNPRDTSLLKRLL